jgi:hypothetical protein
VKDAIFYVVGGKGSFYDMGLDILKLFKENSRIFFPQLQLIVPKYQIFLFTLLLPSYFPKIPPK